MEQSNSEKDAPVEIDKVTEGYRNGFRLGMKEGLDKLTKNPSLIEDLISPENYVNHPNGLSEEDQIQRAFNAGQNRGLWRVGQNIKAGYIPTDND